jgi:hypothetical protein
MFQRERGGLLNKPKPAREATHEWWPTCPKFELSFYEKSVFLNEYL